MPVGKKCWSRLSVDAATGQMIVDEFLLCDMGVFAKRERRSRIDPPYEGAPAFIPVPISRGAILWRKVRDVTVNRAEGIITVYGNRDSRVALYSSGDTMDEILAWIDDALEQNPLLLDAAGKKPARWNLRPRRPFVRAFAFSPCWTARCEWHRPGGRCWQ